MYKLVPKRRCRVCQRKNVTSRASSGFCAACWNEPFRITSVCRADLQRYFTPAEIAAIDMPWLARKMAEAYCDHVFWIDLEIIGRDAIDRDELEAQQPL